MKKIIAVESKQPIPVAWDPHTMPTEEDKNNFTWNDFIINTTFHGVRYVFEANTKKRR